jgi:hypothetical protein
VFAQRRPARYSLRAVAVGLAAAPLVLMTSVATAAIGDDNTAPYGQFGMTTLGLKQYGTGSYGEPTFAVAPDGRHLLASTPGCGGVCSWASPDDGATWTKAAATGAGGDSEVDFVPTPDGVVTLSADLALLKVNTSSTQNSYIHTSGNFGQSWDSTKRTTAGIEQDRQWLAHSSDGQTAYLVYHDFAAEAEVYAKGTYNATTKTFDWPQQDAAHLVNSPDQLAPPNVAIAAKPGDAVSVLDQGVNTYSGPMLVAPKSQGGDDLYVVYSISNFESNSTTSGGGVPPYGGVRSIAVAHSGDGGTTWNNRYAVVAPSATDPSQEESNGTMFPWGFVDQAGTVYVVYDSTHDNKGTDHYGFYYVYSKDKGSTWSSPVRLDNLPAGQGSVVFNTGAAVTPGVIDVAWLQKDTGSLSTDTGPAEHWYPWFAQIENADTATPHVVGSQKMTTVRNHNGGVCIQGILCGIAPGSADRSLLDFFEMAVNPVTHMAEVAYADNGGQRPGSAANNEVVFAQQTLQPTLGPHSDVPEVPSTLLLPVAGLLLLGLAARFRRGAGVPS